MNQNDRRVALVLKIIVDDRKSHKRYQAVIERDEEREELKTRLKMLELFRRLSSEKISLLETRVQELEEESPQRMQLL